MVSLANKTMVTELILYMDWIIYSTLLDTWIGLYTVQCIYIIISFWLMSCNIYQEEAVWIRMAYKTITMLCHSIMSFRNSVHIVFFFLHHCFFKLVTHRACWQKVHLGNYSLLCKFTYSVMPKRMSGLWENRSS